MNLTDITPEDRSEEDPFSAKPDKTLQIALAPGETLSLVLHDGTDRAVFNFVGKEADAPADPGPTPEEKVAEARQTPPGDAPAEHDPLLSPHPSGVTEDHPEGAPVAAADVPESTATPGDPPVVEAAADLPDPSTTLLGTPDPHTAGDASDADASQNPDPAPDAPADPLLEVRDAG